MALGTDWDGLRGSGCNIAGGSVDPLTNRANTGYPNCHPEGPVELSHKAILQRELWVLIP